jgi:hypothetical protein
MAIGGAQCLGHVASAAANGPVRSCAEVLMGMHREIIFYGN